MRYSLIFLTVFVYIFFPGSGFAKDPVIIELNQTPCVIVEAEKTPKHYNSTSYSQCARINKETRGKRAFKPLKLKPGKTIFRVTNKNVPYELGFWVRGKGLSRAILPSVSGGGLTRGKTQDYEIDLKPGEYFYSCPLNPTPDYSLIVSE